MIKSINLSSLRNGEFIQFILDVESLVSQSDPAVLKVLPQYNAVKAVRQSLEALFKTDQGSDLTDELLQTDLRRDDALTGVTLIISGYAYSAEPEIKAYAKALDAHIALFGTGIARANYQSETTTIRNIIDDWKQKSNLTAAIAALNLLSWQAELEAANELFNKIYLERSQETGAVSPDTIKAKRLEAAGAWYKLRDFLDSYFTLGNGAEPYASVNNSLNAVIDSYNTLLAGRGKKPAKPAKS